MLPIIFCLHRVAPLRCDRARSLRYLERFADHSAALSSITPAQAAAAAVSVLSLISNFFARSGARASERDVHLWLAFGGGMGMRACADLEIGSALKGRSSDGRTDEPFNDVAFLRHSPQAAAIIDRLHLERPQRYPS